MSHRISDIDECDADTHNCSSDAVCTNTKGFYKCTCKPGHSGNGHSCTSEVYFFTCSSHVIIRKTPINIKLDLILFSLIIHILDINECEAKTHNCSANATCINTKGSFKCTCKPGYDGNGHNCTGKCLFSVFLPVSFSFVIDPNFFKHFLFNCTKTIFSFVVFGKRGICSSVMK